MTPDPGPHHRRSIRLPYYDYSSPGAYFITVATVDRHPLLGNIRDDRTHLSPAGAIVADCWREISCHFPGLELDEFVVMPNHVHGILTIHESITGTAAREHSPDNYPRMAVAAGSLGAIIRSFKAAATRRVNALRGTPGARLWQRNYYEHVVRNEESLAAIRRYIRGNPAMWPHDVDYPDPRTLS